MSNEQILVGPDPIKKSEGSKEDLEEKRLDIKSAIRLLVDPSTEDHSVIHSGLWVLKDFGYFMSLSWQQTTRELIAIKKSFFEDLTENRIGELIGLLSDKLKNINEQLKNIN